MRSGPKHREPRGTAAMARHRDNGQGEENKEKEGGQPGAQNLRNVVLFSFPGSRGSVCSPYRTESHRGGSPTDVKTVQRASNAGTGGRGQWAVERLDDGVVYWMLAIKGGGGGKVRWRLACDRQCPDIG